MFKSDAHHGVTSQEITGRSGHLSLQSDRYIFELIGVSWYFPGRQDTFFVFFFFFNLTWHVPVFQPADYLFQASGHRQAAYNVSVILAKGPLIKKRKDKNITRQTQTRQRVVRGTGVGVGGWRRELEGAEGV